MTSLLFMIEPDHTPFPSALAKMGSLIAAHISQKRRMLPTMLHVGLSI